MTRVSSSGDDFAEGDQLIAAKFISFFPKRCDQKVTNKCVRRSTHAKKIGNLSRHLSKVEYRTPQVVAKSEESSRLLAVVHFATQQPISQCSTRLPDRLSF